MKLRDLRTPFNLLSDRQQLALLEEVRANRHQIAKERSPSTRVKSGGGIAARPGKPRLKRPKNLQELQQWMQQQLITEMNNGKG